MTKQAKFIAAVAVQLIIIFGIIIFKVAVLTGGTEVLLRIEPVDPRDPLRGDYVRLQYSVSNPSSYFVGQDQSVRNGDTVYVSVRQRGKYWVAESIQKTKPTSGEIFLKGRVESGGMQSQADPLRSRRFDDSRPHIVYGIEDYFIPEGTGRGINFWNRDQEAFAQVAVDENGNAVLKQLYIDDRPWP